MSDDILRDAANEAANYVMSVTETDLKVAPEKQYKNADPYRAYACWFTAFHMYFQKTANLALTWSEYRDACLRNGAIGRDFAILDESGEVSKIAAAAGVVAIRRDTTQNISAKITELLAQGKPVPCSLNGEHYELITGQMMAGGQFCFTANDPGWQNDTYATGDTLQMYRLENGKRVFSVGHDGKLRHITRIYWFE